MGDQKQMRTGFTLYPRRLFNHRALEGSLSTRKYPNTLEAPERIMDTSMLIICSSSEGVVSIAERVIVLLALIIMIEMRKLT